MNTSRPSPILMEARPLVAQIHQDLAKRCEQITLRRGTPPGLAVILVGQDPASQIYVRKKAETAEKVGMKSSTFLFPDTATPDSVFKKIQTLNQDPTVDGILIQRPLPRHFEESQVAYWVDPSKDVDAFHPENVGRLVLGLPCFSPCTPAGVIELLRHYQIPLEGKTACVLGRSSIVGKPMASLLLQQNATLIQVHSKSENILDLTRQADLLVVAMGRPEKVTGDWIRKGSVVVDVGIHRNSEGRIVGDCHFESVSQMASAITPVPGSVGPMTITQLLKNTVISAENRLHSDSPRVI